MEKLKLIPLALFSILGCKLVLLKPTWEDVALLIILGLVSCYIEYRQQDNKLEQLDARLKGIEKSLDEAKVGLAGMKLHTTFKSNKVG